MKKHRWYSISKNFVIVLILVALSCVSVPLYKYLEWHMPGFIAHITHPSIPQVSGIYYGNADFGIVINPIGAPPAGTASVFFYKEYPGTQSLNRIARISGIPPATGRPSAIGDILYFPQYEVFFASNKTSYITMVSTVNKNCNTRWFARKIKLKTPNGEFIIGINNKIFVIIGRGIEVFDKNMDNLIKTITPPEGENFFHIYKYNGKVYALETSKTDTVLREIDPDTLEITKTLHFNFTVAPDGNHCAIVRFKGKVYATGYDGPLKTGAYVHRVIYELTNTITPAYIYPEKIELCESIDKCHNKVKLHSEDPHISFSFNAFVPINPENKEFLLLGRTSLLAKKVHYYVFDTLTNKFTEMPPQFMLNGNDDLSYDSGVYSKGRVYIATARYLLCFEDGKFEKVDTFGRRKYDTIIFLLNNNTW